LVGVGLVVSGVLLRGRTKEVPVAKESGKICPSCGFENPYLAKNLCENCGASLAKISVKTPLDIFPM
jgi:ribosomal protein L37AE/L43A